MAEDARTSLIDIAKPYPLIVKREGQSGGALPLSVEEEIGRGASCIAYRAVDESGQARVLKELYPLGSDVAGISRDACSATLEIPESEHEAFDKRAERFSSTAAKFREYWEWDTGLYEAPRPFELGEANNTLYAVSDPPIGSLLTDEPPEDMNGIANVMLSLCNALAKFHGHRDEGGEPDPLLYLDLKPDNIYWYRHDKAEHALLFDFDTVVSKADLRQHKYRFSSYSAGWAPPEQVDWEVSEISEASDVYALGTVLFWLVTGRKPTRGKNLGTASDLSLIQEGTFDWVAEKRDGLAFDRGGKIEKALSAIIGVTLVENPSHRLQSACELPTRIEELSDWAEKNGDHPFLSDHITKEGESTRETMLSAKDEIAEGINATEQRLAERIDRAASGKRVPKLAIAALCALVAAAVVGALLLFNPQSNGSFSNAAYAYASDIRGYKSAGSTASYAELSAEVSNSVETDKAFSIVGFVRNNGDSAARVESVTTEFLSLEPIEEPALLADAAINDNTFLIYVANNGWGASEPLTVDIYASQYDSQETRIELEELGTSTIIKEATAYQPGDLKKAALLSVDPESFKSLASKEAYPGAPEHLLSIRAIVRETGESLGTWHVSYSDEGGLSFYTQGVGGDGDDYSVTLFGVLDVDAAPAAIKYLGAEASPRVEDTFRIETVVAPTKSCRVKCKNVYSVNGSLQETPEYDAAVTVPYYSANAFDDYYAHPGSLTKELSQIPEMDDAQIQATAEKYLYDPASVEEQANNA